MKKSKAMLFIAPALFSYALAAQACTTLAIQDKQGDVFHGRTLEYMQDLPSWLTYYPAGTQFDKKTPDGSQGVSYQAKYPILAITSTITDGDSRDILEGMNSAGLSYYTQLTNVDRSSGTLGGIKVMQPDSGIAIADLPSSDTSVSRFIRGVYYTTYAPQATSAHDAMNTLAHIMSRFDRPKNITVDYMGSEGEGNATRKPVSEYTVWTTLSDLTHGEMMVRGYNDINYKTWSLSQFKNATAPVFEKINVKG